ncbi:MAG: hypothetical protein KDK48_00520 [Chlamydiia bacterium]|nr:hypothetical protein [Chlamydiia bacterium]
MKKRILGIVTLSALIVCANAYANDEERQDEVVFLVNDDEQEESALLIANDDQEESDAVFAFEGDDDEDEGEEYASSDDEEEGDALFASDDEEEGDALFASDDEEEGLFLAKNCSEGGCPIQMIERLREEKRLERAKLKQNSKTKVATEEHEEESVKPRFIV